jgi:thiol:disulfide interchange protein DsbD
MRVNQALALTWLACCACCCFPLAVSAQALRTITTDTGILDADTAFGFKPVINSNSVLLNWAIKPGYYLYQSKLAFTDSNGKAWSTELPPATPIVDEFLGESRVYFDSLQLRLPLPRNPVQTPANYSLTVQFQGCAKDRYCYPPQTRTIPLGLP